MKRSIGWDGKRHSGGCKGDLRGDDYCDCRWKGKYRGEEGYLDDIVGRPVNPRSRKEAKIALGEFVVAVRNGEYQNGKIVKVAGALTLKAFIDEFQMHHVDAKEQTATSTRHMLRVIKDGRLGSMMLLVLADDPLTIQSWLDAEAKARLWKNVTWNQYRALLHLVFEKVRAWKKVKGKPLLAGNPLDDIDRRRRIKPDHFKRRVLLEAIEAKLFAVVDQLNRVQHGPNTRSVLTLEKADAIRARVAAGEPQRLVAAAFKVSATVVCQIVKGDIWNPAKLHRVGTKGSEMKRRLIAAFDIGLRAGEMLRAQVKHVRWSVRVVEIDGTPTKIHALELPPEITKGGKSSGETEIVYVVPLRARLMLEARCFQLQHCPEAHLFGTDAGIHQQSFRKLWHALFALAGIAFGRDVGVVWHTIRHEYISRLMELTKDSRLTQELARHQELETTELYMAAREDQKIAALARLGGATAAVRFQ